MKWAVKVPKDERPAILNERHKDWQYKPNIPVLGFILGILTWPLAQIPRSWTSWLGKPPRKLLGTAEEFHFEYFGMFAWGFWKHPKPIPDKGGEWWLGWPLYLAWRITDEWYIRFFLFRWDDADEYYALTFFSPKRYKKS